MAITTPALHSLGSELIPERNLQFANGWLMAEGINPLLAFVDEEINRHHRAIAMSADVMRETTTITPVGINDTAGSEYTS